MKDSLRTTVENSGGRHNEATLYLVWVLWVYGFTERSIGTVAGLERKQVAGIVSRSPYPNRSAMSREERQLAYDELLSMRQAADGTLLDGGVLDRIPKKILALGGRQLKD